MRTQPTDPSFTPADSEKLAILAHNINLPGLSVVAILNQHRNTPVLIKVLQLFQDKFSWAKAGMVLHSDKEIALDMIQRVAIDIGQKLPPKDPMESH